MGRTSALMFLQQLRKLLAILFSVWGKLEQEKMEQSPKTHLHP